MKHRMSNKAYNYTMGVFLASFLLYAIILDGHGMVGRHLSNFAFTGALMLFINHSLYTKKGYSWRLLYLSAIPFTVLNLVIETVVRVNDVTLFGVTIASFNTPDVVDMLYGFAAIAVVVLVGRRAK